MIHIRQIVSPKLKKNTLVASMKNTRIIFQYFFFWKSAQKHKFVAKCHLIYIAKWIYLKNKLWLENNYMLKENLLRLSLNLIHTNLNSVIAKTLYDRLLL